MRSDLIVLGSREGVVKGGIEWSIILVFVRKLVNKLELKSGSLNSDLEYDQCSPALTHLNRLNLYKYLFPFFPVSSMFA